MKRLPGWSSLPATAVMLLLLPAPLCAQSTVFPNSPVNHWAYQYLSELDHKGYVIGYDGENFSGQQSLSRFEFANAVERIMSTVHGLRSAVDEKTITSAGAPVTNGDLDKIRELIDTFQPELSIIQADATGAKEDLQDLRAELKNYAAPLQAAADSAAMAEDTAVSSYGNVVGRPFSITGYIQSRFVSSASRGSSIYRQYNNTANAGGIAAAVNGTYAEGGTPASAEVRRARIYFEGSPTRNTYFQAQIDTSGAVASYPGSNQQVILIQAFGTYKFGNGGGNSPALSAGLLLNPFGYAVGVLPAAMLTPERPLAFNLTNNVGLWDSQDTDKGVSLSFGSKKLKWTYALINGSGRQEENTLGHFDSVIRAAYTSPIKVIDIGASYYNGLIARGGATGNGDSAISLSSNPEPKKQLFGVDAQVKRRGFFAEYEFVRGTYEKRSYFDENLANPLVNPIGFETDNYVKGNQVQGSYIWFGYSYHEESDHMLTLGIDYDTFQRSMSSHRDAANSTQSSLPTGASAAYFPSGSSWDDVNAGIGALYGLDKSARLRLWYDKPIAVAHAPGTPEPPMIGLYTAELQVKF